MNIDTCKNCRYYQERGEVFRPSYGWKEEVINICTLCICKVERIDCPLHLSEETSIINNQITLVI